MVSVVFSLQIEPGHLNLSSHNLQPLESSTNRHLTDKRIRNVWCVFVFNIFIRTKERDVAHGAMGRRIDPSWGGPIELSISRSSQCSTTGVTKAVVCVILSVGWCI